MEEIAADAGTSKSIVYRYFTDKTGLQIAVAEAVVLQIQGALEGVLRVAPTPRDGLRAMVAVYLEMIESSPNVYAFVTRNGSVESGGPLGHFLDSVTALVAAPFARGLTEEHNGRAPHARGDARPTTTLLAARVALAESWAAGAVGFVRGSGEWWLAHRDEPGQPRPRGDHRPGRRMALGRTRGPAGPRPQARRHHDATARRKHEHHHAAPRDLGRRRRATPASTPTSPSTSATSARSCSATTPSSGWPRAR